MHPIASPPAGPKQGGRHGVVLVVSPLLHAAVRRGAEAHDRCGCLLGRPSASANSATAGSEETSVSNLHIAC